MNKQKPQNNNVNETAREELRNAITSATQNGNGNGDHVSDTAQPRGFQKTASQSTHNNDNVPIATQSSSELAHQPREVSEKKQRRATSPLVVNTLATIGTIAIVILLGWGIVKASPFIARVSSSLAASIVSITSVFTQSEKIIIDDIRPLNSGDTTTLSWTHEAKDDDGSYTFAYGCVEGVSIEASVTTGADAQFVFCNTPFSFSSSDNTIDFTVTYRDGNPVRVPVFIAFTPNGDDEPSIVGEHSFIISADNSTTNVTTPTGNNGGNNGNGPTTTTNNPPRLIAGPSSETSYIFGSTTTTSRPSNPFGNPDLAVRVLDVGVIDPVTNEFTATTTHAKDDRVAARFEVENIGDKDSATWYFNIFLPSDPPYLFRSEPQQALGVADTLQFTMGFDNIQIGRNDIVFTADPGNRIFESNEKNNMVSARINIPLR